MTIIGKLSQVRFPLHQKGPSNQNRRSSRSNTSFIVDNANEALYIELDATGQVEVTVTYTGKITDNMTGIYPSYYTVDGVKKKSFLLNLRVTLLVKLFQAWMSQKLKQLLTWL